MFTRSSLFFSWHVYTFQIGLSSINMRQGAWKNQGVHYTLLSFCDTPFWELPFLTSPYTHALFIVLVLCIRLYTGLSIWSWSCYRRNDVFEIKDLVSACFKYCSLEDVTGALARMRSNPVTNVHIEWNSLTISSIDLTRCLASFHYLFETLWLLERQ